MTPAPPVLWQCLVGYWQLDQAEATQLWQALWHSRWSAAVSLRQTLCHFSVPAPSGAGVDSIAAFFDSVVSPQTVMTVLDELTREGRIRGPLAVRVTEKVLARVNRHGQWD